MTGAATAMVYSLYVYRPWMASTHAFSKSLSLSVVKA